MSLLTIMTPSMFCMDATGDHAFVGYTDGNDWNGWAKPHFTIDVALSVVEALRPSQNAYYDEQADEFVFEPSEGDEERFGGVEVDGIGKLYSIGAGSWIWEEVEA